MENNDNKETTNDTTSENPMPQTTTETVKLTPEAKRALYKLKDYNETYSEAILRLIEFYKKHNPD